MSREPQPLIEVPAWLAELGVAHLAEYFGAWAVYEPVFREAVGAVQGIDLRAHVAAQSAAGDAPRERSFAVTEAGVAVIELRGSLMKQTSSLSGNTSTVRVRKQVRDAAADSLVRGIVLKIDSPGGTVAGTAELANEVHAAAARKRVAAYCDDLCASAAYWIGSQATRLVANGTALVGSIGTFAVIHDVSQRAAALGIKVHVLRAGAQKGAGTPGTEVTAEQLADWQRLVDTLNEHFLAGVARGRKLDPSAVRALADGRVHVGAEAQRLGLVDAIETWDETLAWAAGGTGKPRTRTKGATMDGEADRDSAPKAATLAELKAACAGAPSDFLLAQLEAGATVPQAMKAWNGELQAKLTAATAEREKLATEKAEAEQRAREAAAKKPGCKVLGNAAHSGKPGAAADDGEPEADVADFDALVRAEMKANGGQRMKAVATMARRHPEAHQAYLAQSNARGKPQRLIAEKYEGFAADER